MFTSPVDLKLELDRELGEFDATTLVENLLEMATAALGGQEMSREHQQYLESYESHLRQLPVEQLAQCWLPLRHLQQLLALVESTFEQAMAQSLQQHQKSDS